MSIRPNGKELSARDVRDLDLEREVTARMMASTLPEPAGEIAHAVQGLNDAYEAMRAVADVLRAERDAARGLKEVLKRERDDLLALVAELKGALRTVVDPHCECNACEGVRASGVLGR